LSNSPFFFGRLSRLADGPPKLNRRLPIMIYRVARNVGDGSYAPATTSRAPGNVPYYVDNIWEWLRPEGAPSRRRAAFASPTPELAAVGAQGDVADAWHVELIDGQPAYQIIRGAHPHDARYHADIARLKSLIIGELRRHSWFDLPLSDRKPELDLFAPCVLQADMREIIETSIRLDAESLKAACTFWSDVEIFDPRQGPPHPTGEVFFEGAYRLSRIE
jgi:hypothetical protein